MCVNLLQFARWMRRLATIKPDDQGVLYRSKAVLAVAGSNKRLVFHAVSGVMEKEVVSEWPAGATKGCKIVFIGKKLQREWFETTFKTTLQPIRSDFALTASASSSASAATIARDGILVALLRQAPAAFYRTMAHCLSVDVLSTGYTCRELANAVFGTDSGEQLMAAGRGFHGFHKKGDDKLGLLRLHTVLPMASVATYARAFVASKVQVVTYPGLLYRNEAEAESAGVTWLELAEQADEATNVFVVDFTWRSATIAEFCSSGPDASTKSTLVKTDVYNDEEDEWDTLKFRLMLWPASKTLGAVERTDGKKMEGEAGEAAAASSAGADAGTSGLQQHKVVMQLVGKSASQVYHLSFHTIHPSYQVHVKVPDHRIPIFESKELVHKWHAMMVGLQENPVVRMVVRIKPDGSGPLGDMCGCC
jgi:hypothetical protein